MTKIAKQQIARALEFLRAVGIPPEQHNERSALTLLALANIGPREKWYEAEAPLRRITEMMDWMRSNFSVNYAPNTRETIRRQTIHQFVQHGLAVENPDQPNRPINSPKWCYQLAPSVLSLIQNAGTPRFDSAIEIFLKRSDAGKLLARHRTLPREIVRLPQGREIELSAGGQNVLIKSIIEEFVPRFVRNPRVLLLGDAADKESSVDSVALSRLGIELPPRGKAPDIVVHDEERNWLVIIEAVTSHGPVDQKRKNELEGLFECSTAGLVLVSAFPDSKVFSRFQSVIAWETEVWIADAPDHMIHYNGTRFLGPYQK